jgi:hypothetical protein
MVSRAKEGEYFTVSEQALSARCCEIIVLWKYILYQVLSAGC